MRLYFIFLLLLALFACEKKDANNQLLFKTIDTDFSKGRLTHIQTHSLQDLEKFHGHLCDGLVVGALAMKVALDELYPHQQAIDRTNLRVVSKPSPCLTDVAIYLSGARYQFNTFYVDTAFEGLYILQKIDDLKTVSVALNKGIKPSAIDSMGNLAIQQKLTACELEFLRKIEDEFTASLLQSNPKNLFTVTMKDTFAWQAKHIHSFQKTDILNKNIAPCANGNK
jgi:formylmethanofuran dehydrogenase subunit E